VNLDYILTSKFYDTMVKKSAYFVIVIIIIRSHRSTNYMYYIHRCSLLLPTE